MKKNIFYYSIRISICLILIASSNNALAQISFSYDLSGNRIKKAQATTNGCLMDSLRFSGKVFLQAVYNPDSSSMINLLNTNGILQAKAQNQPYNIDGFQYAGNEHVGEDFYKSHDDIVDWILIEIRDKNVPSIVIASRAAFLRRNGNIIETNGEDSLIVFPGIPKGSYYLVIRHRNHLGIETSIPIDFGAGNAYYDFTTSSDKAFQNQSYTSTIQVGTIWAMRAGNANSNGSVKYNGPSNDQNQILNVRLGGSLSLILNNVYSAEDINMNGNVKWNGPGNDQNFLLNSILQGSLSTIYNEQLYNEQIN